MGERIGADDHQARRIILIVFQEGCLWYDEDILVLADRHGAFTKKRSFKVLIGSCERHLDRDRLVSRVHLRLDSMDDPCISPPRPRRKLHYCRLAGMYSPDGRSGHLSEEDERCRIDDSADELL